MWPAVSYSRKQEDFNVVKPFFIDLLYFGNKIVELPSFERFTKCKVAPHPIEELGIAVTGLLNGKVVTCGG